MTRVLLIYAGPTPWDDEDRLVGNHPLPLTDRARATIEGIVSRLKDPVTAVYRCGKNEACDQVAKMIASAFKLRARDTGALDEMDLGLWQGLTRSELRFRFPRVFPQWEQSPLAVNPPDAESLEDATQRLRDGMKSILRRNRGGGSVAFPLRPFALQIVLGLLRGENIEAIASHLHKITAVETMDIAGKDL